MCSPVKIVFFGGTLRKLWQIQPEHWHMAAFPPHSGCAYWTTLLSRLSWWLPPGRFLDPYSVYFTHSISLLGSSGSDSVQNFSWDIFSWRCRLEEWSWAIIEKHSRQESLWRVGAHYTSFPELVFITSLYDLRLSSRCSNPLSMQIAVQTVEQLV